MFTFNQNQDNPFSVLCKKINKCNEMWIHLNSLPWCQKENIAQFKFNGWFHPWAQSGWVCCQNHNNGNGLFYGMPFTLEIVAQTNSALRLEFKWHTPDHEGKVNKMFSPPSFRAGCLEHAIFSGKRYYIEFHMNTTIGFYTRKIIKW